MEPYTQWPRRGRPLPARVPLLHHPRRLFLRHRRLQHLRPGPCRQRPRRHPEPQLDLLGGGQHRRRGRSRQHRHHLHRRRQGRGHLLARRKQGGRRLRGLLRNGDWDDEANAKDESGSNRTTSGASNRPFIGSHHNGTERLFNNASRALGASSVRGRATERLWYL